MKIEHIVEDWTFIISGRTDLVQITTNSITVEEIKSVNNLTTFCLDTENGMLFKLQLLFYAHYFKNKYPDKTILCKLVIIDIFTQVKQIHQVELLPITPFLDEKCSQFLSKIRESSQQKKIRNAREESIIFPFENTRPHQDEIMEVTFSTLKKKGDLMLIAPSGIGKTVGTLYPTLKFAIGHGKRLFIVTSKTTQQKMYEDTLRLFSQKKGKFNAILLTAKEKLCLNSIYACDPIQCSYADRYPTNYEDTLKSMLKTNIVTARYIRKKAKEIGVCPFELALDCSLFCDVIIGDFNYVFSPMIKLQRFFKGKFNNFICIIDEAHNLPERAREYYSPELSQEMVLECMKFMQIQPIPAALRTGVTKTLQDLVSYIQKVIISLNNPGLRVASTEFNLGFFSTFLDTLEAHVMSYVEFFLRDYEVEPKIGDPFIVFVKQVHFFVQILEQTHLDEFEQLIYPQERKLKIFCKSASNFLKKQMKGFHSVIAQSATLQPVGFYREMLGLPNNTEILLYSSPFPVENRLYLDFPFVSTRYEDRCSSFPRIAQLIHEIIQIQKGNYLVFFPSFSYMFSVLHELKKLPLNSETILQKRRMSEKERKVALQKLKSGLGTYLLLAVHGGIFSEGVDYPGKMAIGAFIVSPGLPQYCYEQELMKNYFQKQYFQGFEFAYRNPGLTRVIQAAGRIFRSETDKGLVLLIGQRFHTTYYREVLPKDWNIESPEDMIGRIRKFWSS